MSVVCSIPMSDAEPIRSILHETVPEIANGIVEIMATARVPGLRTKIAVHSHDPDVDCVGACVGIRGHRIRNVVDRLAGERLDIVRWNDDPCVFICNALQPAEIDDVVLEAAQSNATVIVRDDQQSLAIGRRGQNQILASELCGYNIEVVTMDP